MVTRTLIKEEIDRVPEQHLPVLYQVVVALEDPAGPQIRNTAQGRAAQSAGDAWLDFVAETYGCLADDPIQRGDQGRYESRETLR
ncbi:MAG: hypothetical protein GY856_48750 [bacterium]|nr:hypothetical protein [bacterium]